MTAPSGGSSGQSYNRRRADALTDRRLLIARFLEYLPSVGGGITLAGTIVLLGAFSYLARSHKVRLEQRALTTPAQHGTALVTRIDWVGNKYNRIAYCYRIDFKVNGTIVSVYVSQEQMAKLARTHVGDTVGVTYHTLPGVITVVDDWEPPAVKMPIHGR